MHCYQVESGKWEERGLDRSCAAPGYNQLLVSGTADNSLEDAFSKVESRLPETLRALEDIIDGRKSNLSDRLHESLCMYCAFLKGIAPYSKPGAVVSFIIQMNMELETKRYSLLRDLCISDETIFELAKHVSKGYKILIEAENLIQLLYRFQFSRTYQSNYSQFLRTRWKVCHSPLHLPISDVGLVPMLLKDQRATRYLLPFSPNLLLEGIFFHDLEKNSTQPAVEGIHLTETEAEYRFDCVCASAIEELICSRRIPGLAEARIRANANGTVFSKLPNPNALKTSGLIDIGEGEILFRAVSLEEYVALIHSYAQPWNGMAKIS